MFFLLLEETCSMYTVTVNDLNVKKKKKILVLTCEKAFYIVYT